MAEKGKSKLPQIYSTSTPISGRQVSSSPMLFTEKISPIQENPPVANETKLIGLVKKAIKKLEALKEPATRKEIQKWIKANCDLECDTAIMKAIRKGVNSRILFKLPHSNAYGISKSPKLGPTLKKRKQSASEKVSNKKSLHTLKIKDEKVKSSKANLHTKKRKDGKKQNSNKALSPQKKLKNKQVSCIETVSKKKTKRNSSEISKKQRKAKSSNITAKKAFDKLNTVKSTNKGKKQESKGKNGKVKNKASLPQNKIVKRKSKKRQVSPPKIVSKKRTKRNTVSLSEVAIKRLKSSTKSSKQNKPITSEGEPKIVQKNTAKKTENLSKIIQKLKLKQNESNAEDISEQSNTNQRNFVGKTGKSHIDNKMYERKRKRKPLIQENDLDMTRKDTSDTEIDTRPNRCKRIKFCASDSELDTTVKSVNQKRRKRKKQTRKYADSESTLKEDKNNL